MSITNSITAKSAISGGKKQRQDQNRSEHDEKLQRRTARIRIKGFVIRQQSPGANTQSGHYLETTRDKSKIFAKSVRRGT